MPQQRSEFCVMLTTCGEADACGVLSGSSRSEVCALAGGAPAHGRRGGGAGRAMQQLQSRGGGANSNSGVMSERAAWMALIEDLKKR